MHHFWQLESSKNLPWKSDGFLSTFWHFLTRFHGFWAFPVISWTLFVCFLIKFLDDSHFYPVKYEYFKDRHTVKSPRHFWQVSRSFWPFLVQNLHLAFIMEQRPKAKFDFSALERPQRSQNPRIIQIQKRRHFVFVFCQFQSASWDFCYDLAEKQLSAVFPDEIKTQFKAVFNLRAALKIQSKGKTLHKSNS